MQFLFTFAILAIYLEKPQQQFSAHFHFSQIQNPYTHYTKILANSLIFLDITPVLYGLYIF